MSFLTRARSDRGATATIIAILLGGGVLLGMTALVVDVGRLYVEREELQSGADSAAMAVALDCAKLRDSTRDAQCRAAAGTAPGYADANAGDAASAVRFVCGNDARLPTCTGFAAGNSTDCIGTVPASASYAEVRTNTELPSGEFILPPVFAQTLSNYRGTSVGACARVGWGAPNGGFALTFSDCEYDLAVANGDFVTGTPEAADEVVLYTHGHSAANECNSGPSGANLPGGFGWVEHSADCLTTITGTTYDSDPGNATPSDCQDELAALIASRTPIGIPIFQDKTGGGSNGRYTLEGFAAFVVTGYHLPAMHPKDQPSWLTGTSTCTGNEDCIYGYFTEALVEWSGSFGSAPSLGATVIKTIG